MTARSQNHVSETLRNFKLHKRDFEKRMAEVRKERDDLAYDVQKRVEGVKTVMAGQFESKEKPGPKTWLVERKEVTAAAFSAKKSQADRVRRASCRHCSAPTPR